MNFTADHVWALAVIANRMNGGYIKEDAGHWDDDERFVLEKTANKKLVKQWLREGGVEPTEADIVEGQTIRNYFKTFIMRELSGKITDFERQALKIANKDYFGGKDLLEFAVVSCLPSSMVRDQQRVGIAKEIFGSTQLQGAVGDVVRGEIEVIKCNYSQNYDKFRVSAKLGDSFVDFWFAKECQAGDRFTIKGKIKSVRGDKTTQLNFVKRG